MEKLDNNLIYEWIFNYIHILGKVFNRDQHIPSIGVYGYGNTQGIKYIKPYPSEVDYSFYYGSLMDFETLTTKKKYCQYLDNPITEFYDYNGEIWGKCWYSDSKLDKVGYLSLFRLVYSLWTRYICEIYATEQDVKHSPLELYAAFDHQMSEGWESDDIIFERMRKLYIKYLDELC